MKKYLLLLAMLLSLVSCGTSNEDKAKKAIKAYLEESLDNAKTYEPVSWGELDSVIMDSAKDEKYHKLKEDLEITKKTIDLRNTLLNMYITSREPEYKITDAKSRLRKDSAMYESAKVNIKLYLLNYEHGFIGWKVYHSYRASNGVGAIVLNKKQFFVREDFDGAVDIATYD